MGTSAKTLSREEAAALLKGFDAVVGRSAIRGGRELAALREFIETFALLQARSDATEARDAHTQRELVESALEGFSVAESKWIDAERSRASTFSILDALGLTDKELKHSNALAWLLSRDIYAPGSHAQGELGFRIFLEHMRWPREWADEDYVVRRECANENSRIDIEVFCRNKFVIHIENKIWSSEGEKQLEREADDLSVRAAELKATHIRAIYLTPKGEVPYVQPFEPLSWSRVAAMFSEFAVRADGNADMVVRFSEHYANAVWRSISSIDLLKEQDNGEEDVQRSRGVCAE